MTINDTFEPKIIGFLCNWCSYAGADLAGTSRAGYPSNLRIMRVPCSARVDPLFVFKAFQDGADGVMVLGCHPGDCHYREGNYFTQRRYALMHRLLEFIGVETERLYVDWVSAAEGTRFAEIVTDFTEQVRALGTVGTPFTDAVGAEGKLPDAVVGASFTSAVGAGIKPAATGGEPSYAVREAEQHIRAAARRYLANGEVSCVIGWERGSRGKMRPAFIRDADDAERLVWDDDGALNLAVYLHNYQQEAKVAVVARSGETRAINLLIQERQIARENVKVIEVEEQVTADDYADVAELESWTPAERRAFWTRELDRCILCYACRQACPGCYCYQCVAEQTEPRWTGIARGLREKFFFHVMRAFHLAGRCVECGACAAVCPMDIPLNLLNRKLAKEVQTLFGYRAGKDAKTAPPLATFDPTERLRL